MLQISLAKPAWAVWFPFSYICFEGIDGGAYAFLRLNRLFSLNETRC